MKHINDGHCAECLEILKTADPKLQLFAKSFQEAHPEAHVSEAHRDQAAQEAAFAKGNSKARFGQSPHNLFPSKAIDFFRLTLAGANYDGPWYRDTLGPAARAAGLVWGGDFRSLRDCPHVELPNWRG
jgi:hypothetical protein